MFPGADKALEALLRGQECANYLKTVFEHSKTTSVPTNPHLDTVLESFSDALSFFSNFTSFDSIPRHESCENTATHLVARKSPKKYIDGTKIKKSYGEEGLEHYRDDSPTPLCNDGFSWRKYGQKKIITSLHPRCYYRCAYAKDRNCNATKRVQQIQDSPSIYRTTYVGKHICEVNAFSQPNEDITNGARMIRFDNLDQVMSDLALPQLIVSVDHQEIIEEQGPNQTMNQEFDNSNDFLMDDDQFWESQFPPYSPGNFMFLDNISVFDYYPSEV